MEAIAQPSAMTDSSPRRLEMTSPCTKTVVAQVDVFLPVRERLLADVRERDHRLDARAVTGLQGGEAELARVAAEHDATCDADDDTRLGARLELAVLGAQRGESCA